jgi:hypothetical protein
LSGQVFLCESTKDNEPKVVLKIRTLLDGVISMNKEFPNTIPVSFAFGYGAAQTLSGMPFGKANELQTMKRVMKNSRAKAVEDWREANDTGDEEIEEQKTIELQTVFWEEYAIAYRRGKMFRVGRLRDRLNPYKVKEITNPVRRQAFIDAGLKPVDRTIDYAPGGKAVTISDTFGFFQMSFIKACKDMGRPFRTAWRRPVRSGLAPKTRLD